MADRILTGRVALVTGAARNIGRAIALKLAAAGAAVAVNARASRAPLEDVVREIEAAGGAAAAYLADVTDEAAVEAMVAEAVRRFGRFDILVNNAAIRPAGAVEEMSLAEFRAVTGVILDGAFLCTRAALPHLRLSDGASIVNIGGLTGHIGATRRAHVVAGKAGLVGLTKALAHELAPQGVTVNCVVPGAIDTVRAEGSRASGHPGHPPLIGRRGRSDEVAEMVCYLCGPPARYITGQAIHVNGGAYMP